MAPSEQLILHVQTILFNNDKSKYSSVWFLNRQYFYLNVSMSQWICPDEDFWRNRIKNGTTVSEMTKNES